MIETNSSCNLKCKYCNREDLVRVGVRPLKNLTEEEFRKMLDVFKDCNIDTVKLEGISEPMLHSRFDIMAKILKEYFPEAFVIIATNLQYKVERTPFLRTLDYVDMVYLSIDGTKRIYEEARPGAKYEKLLNSLDDIKRLVPKNVRNQKLHINFVLTGENYNDLPEVYKLRDKYDLSSVRINFAQNWNEGEIGSHSYSNEVIEMARRYKKDVKGVADWNYNRCFWPFAGISVDVFGDVRLCIINTSQVPLCNILKNDVEKYFNESDYYNNIRKSLQHNSATDSCSNCDYKALTEVLGKVFSENLGQNDSRKFEV